MLRGVRRLGEALGPGLSHAVSQAVRASGATDLGTAELSLISLNYPRCHSDSGTWMQASLDLPASDSVVTLILGSMTTASSLSDAATLAHPCDAVEHTQECHRETHRGDSATTCTISQGLPYPYPIHIPTDREVKGSEFTWALRRRQAAGTRTTRAPSMWRGLAGHFPCFRGLLCYLTLLIGPERDSVRLQVTQLISGGQGSGPRPGSTGQCAPLHVPSTEAAGEEDEAWCFIIRRGGTQGQWVGGGE